MSINSNKARLAAITRDLIVQWDYTRENWRDEKSRDFEVRYIDTLRSGVDSAMEVIDQIDKVLSKIRKDCE